MLKTVFVEPKYYYSLYIVCNDWPCWLVNPEFTTENTILTVAEDGYTARML